MYQIVSRINTDLFGLYWLQVIPFVLAHNLSPCATYDRLLASTESWMPLVEQALIYNREPLCLTPVLMGFRKAWQVVEYAWLDWCNLIRMQIPTKYKMRTKYNDNLRPNKHKESWKTTYRNTKIKRSNPTRRIQRLVKPYLSVSIKFLLFVHVVTYKNMSMFSQWSFLYSTIICEMW
jgi:hypothetical protein